MWLIAGAVVSAVVDDLVVVHLLDPVPAKYAVVLVGGYLVYLLGNALFKRMVYGCFLLSRPIGMAVPPDASPVLPRRNLLAAGTLIAMVLASVTGWAALHRRRRRHATLMEHG